MGVLRLHAAVVRVDLRITYQCDQFRTRLRGHAGSTFRTADAVDVRIRHDETLSPCVELRAELCRRRGDVRNRTDQTTPVGAGVTLAHGAGARLQRGDVLAAGSKDTFAFGTHGLVEGVLRFACVSHVRFRHEMFVGDEQFGETQQ